MEVYHIFRGYDVRGIFNKDLTVDVMARIGMAIATYAPANYAVGGDGRGSTPPLKEALIAGLTAAGVDVYDIGTIPIGAAMYSTLHLGYGMAYVTASHLPPEWNGVKLSRPHGDLMVGPDIYAIRDLYMNPSKLRKADYASVGRWARLDILPEYVSFLRKQVKSSGLKIVVDCGNGVASLVAPLVLRDAGHEVLCLNCDIDPRFPARGSEPSPEAVEELRRTVVEVGADFGVAFDGDGDRTLYVDDKGRILTAEQAGIIMLKGGERGDVVANVECSMTIDDYVKSYGGRIFRVPVGRTYIVREVSKRNAVLGVESSGHYVVRRNTNMDDGLLTLVHFTDCVASLGEPLSESVPPSYPILRSKVEVGDEAKFKIVEKIKEKMLAEYDRVETIDGVRVDFDEGWVLIRPSNTEPVIRVTVEGRTREIAEKLLRKYAELVKKSK